MQCWVRLTLQAAELLTWARILNTAQLDVAEDKLRLFFLLLQLHVIPVPKAWVHLPFCHLRQVEMLLGLLLNAISCCRGVAVEPIYISRNGCIYIQVSPDAYALEQLICGKIFCYGGCRRISCCVDCWKK